MENNLPEKIEYSKYEEHYSEASFWDKLKKFALKAGAKVVYGALKLFYSAKNSNTPTWAKSVIYGALGYLILPIDLVPDTIPVVGFADDWALIAAALLTVTAYVTPEVRKEARDKMASWFGETAIAEVAD